MAASKATRSLFSRAQHRPCWSSIGGGCTRSFTAVGRYDLRINVMLIARSISTGIGRTIKRTLNYYPQNSCAGPGKNASHWARTRRPPRGSIKQATPTNGQDTRPRLALKRPCGLVNHCRGLDSEAWCAALREGRGMHGKFEWILVIDARHANGSIGYFDIMRNDLCGTGLADSGSWMHFAYHLRLEQFNGYILL